jgi:hypothetical protein
MRRPDALSRDDISNRLHESETAFNNARRDAAEIDKLQREAHQNLIKCRELLIVACLQDLMPRLDEKGLAMCAGCFKAKPKADVLPFYISFIVNFHDHSMAKFENHIYDPCCRECREKISSIDENNLYQRYYRILSYGRVSMDRENDRCYIVHLETEGHRQEIKPERCQVHRVDKITPDMSATWNLPRIPIEIRASCRNRPPVVNAA